MQNLKPGLKEMLEFISPCKMGVLQTRKVRATEDLPRVSVHCHQSWSLELRFLNISLLS